MRVDGVLFDIDDTLVDTRGAFGHALSDVARRYLPDLPPERHPELVTVWRADVGGHYAAYTRGEVGFVEQRMTRANELHEQFGGPVLDADAFAVWDESFQEAFADAWTAHPDVDAVLDKLLAAGLAVGALSNASVALQTTKLERVGAARPRADARRRRHPRLRQARPAGVRRGVPTAGHRSRAHRVRGRRARRRRRRRPRRGAARHLGRPAGRAPAAR